MPYILLSACHLPLPVRYSLAAVPWPPPTLPVYAESAFGGSFPVHIAAETLPWPPPTLHVYTESAFGSDFPVHILTRKPSIGAIGTFQPCTESLIHLQCCFFLGGIVRKPTSSHIAGHIVYLFAYTGPYPLSVLWKSDFFRFSANH